jgi:4-amino-4-deoxy-L-arabinose transferase-like glycosyltransferase
MCSEHDLKGDAAARPVSSRVETLVAMAVIGLIILLAIVTTDDYGITWDWVGDLYIAERNLNYLISGDPVWLNFNVPVDFSMEGRHPDLTHPDAPPPWRLLYFGAFLSSLGCKVFFQELGWVDAVTAHQLPNILLFGGALLLVYFFVRRSWGFSAALAALAAIAFQPRLWAHLHYNLKDFPYAALMAVTLLVARRAILERSWPMTVTGAALFGIAASTKPNAALILIIIGLWYPFTRRLGRPAERKWSYRTALLAAPLVSLAIYILVWPYLWLDPVEILTTYFRYYIGHAATGPPHFQWDSLLRFLAVQPLAMFLFGGVGVTIAAVGIWKNRQREACLLLLLWLFLPVLRAVLPRVREYDGVRHYLEYAIPLGILGGIGFAVAMRWLHRQARERLPRIAAVPVVLLLLFALPLHWGYRFVRIHPHQLLHFNFLVGGLPGAAQRWSDATDYWGASYRQGSRWLSENAESEALVSVPVANHLAFATRRLWLRDDLVFLRMPMMQDILFPDSLARLQDCAERGERPIYVMYITRPEWYNPLVRVLEQLDIEPVHEILVDGVPILKIHRLDPASETTRRWLDLALGGTRSRPPSGAL